MINEAHSLFVVTDTYRPNAFDKPTFELRFINWDDAGFKTTFDLTLRTPDGPPVEFGYVKVLRSGMLGGRVDLPETFRQLGPDFFSLGQSFSYYEGLAALPEDLRKAVLLGLRDIVASPERRRRATKEQGFHSSLARESRAVRALEDAPRLFRGKVPQDAYASSISREWWAHLAAHGIATTIHFDFRDTYSGVPSRICALVGDNGTGKSAILAALAEAAVSPVSSYGVESLTTPQGSGVNVSRVISISYGAFDQNSYPPSPGQEREKREKDVQIRHFYRGLRVPDNPGTLKTIEQIEDEIWRGLESTKDPKRRDAFEQVLQLVSQVTEFPPDLLESLRSGGNPRASLGRLSSGQMMVLNILVSLIAYLEPGSLVLVDEPEVHLHPPLISALVRGMSLALETFASLAVLATHSSVVVQELQSRNVFVLRRDGDSTIAYRPEIETYGESLGIIDRAVFGLAGSPSDFASVLEELASSGSKSSAERKLKSTLSGQAEAMFLTFKRLDIR